jgi:hypothetical protein
LSEDVDFSEFTKAEERVKYLIDKYPSTKNNDVFLIIMYWRTFDELPLWFDKEYIWGENKITTPETVTRARRKFMEKIREEIKENDFTNMKYLPDPEIEEMRKEMERKARAYARRGP